MLVWISSSTYPTTKDFVQTFFSEKVWIQNTLPTYGLDICPKFRSFFIWDSLLNVLSVTTFYWCVYSYWKEIDSVQDTKIFVTQNILWPNFFGIKNFLGPKFFLNPKYFGTKNFLWSIFFRGPNFFQNRYFFVVQIILGPEFIREPAFFGTQNFLGPKIFVESKFLGPKMFWNLEIFDLKFLGPKIFGT